MNPMIRRINPRVLFRPLVAPTALPQHRFFASIDIPLPPLGAESITEGTVMEWNKKVGDMVKVGETVCVIETDKVTVEVEATTAGVITAQHFAQEATVKVGENLLTVDDAATAGSAAPAPEAAKAGSAAPAPEAQDGKASLQKGFEQAHSTRAGAPAAAPAAAAPAAPAAPKAAPAPSPPKPAVVSTPGAREERRENMTRMRQRIAQRLKDAQNTAALLSTFNEVDMSKAMELRKEYKDLFEKTHGSRFGFMSIFTKAVALALQEIPAINAVIDDATNQIIYRDYVDVSVAVASPRGLVVPVIRNVENMSFLQIEQQLAYLAGKAKNDSITMDDMAGGTFTVSNGGVFGSMLGTPIVNPPQSAILGMHAIKDRAVVVDKQIVIRPMMYLALTYDHRLVDGREAVTFLCSVRDKVEDPRRMLLDL